MKNKWIQKLMILLISLLVLSACTPSTNQEETIIVGGKNFTEQFIMSEMLSMLIEEKTDLNTELKTNLSGTVLFEAIKAQEVDLYLEYTGTALIYLGEEPTTDPDEVLEIVIEGFEKELDMRWSKPYGFNNTYAMVVTQETADQYNLKTVSDMAAVADQLTLGGSYTFTERADGYPGLSEHYNFEFKDVRGIEPSLMHAVLEQGDVDVISAFATDGQIAAFQRVILEDDKQFFPPYDAAVIARSEVLEAHPELVDVLNLLAGRIDDLKMSELNAKVDLDQMEPRDVARDFLVEEGLIDQ